MAVTPVAATDLIPILASDGVTGVNSPRDIRLWMQGLVAPGSSTFTTRDGVLVRGWSGTDYASGKVSAAGGSNTIVTVQPTYDIISRSGQASYLWMMETATNITLSNSDPTNPRIDVICATAYDQVAFGGDPLHGAYLTVVEGTPAGSPVAPSVPSGSLKHAEVLRPANNNTTPGTITNKRKSTCLNGGIRPLLEGDALSDAGNVPGERRYRAASGALPALIDVWDGTTWRGTQTIPFARPSANSGFWTTSTTTTGTSTTYTVAQVTIPDPGWPYYVEAVACYRANSVTGGAYSHASAIRVGSTAFVLTTPPPDTATVSHNFMGAIDSGFAQFRMGGISQQTWTGSQTVYLLTKNGATGTFVIGPLNSQNAYVFDVKIIPA